MEILDSNQVTRYCSRAQARSFCRGACVWPTHRRWSERSLVTCSLFVTLLPWTPLPQSFCDPAGVAVHFTWPAAFMSTTDANASFAARYTYYNFVLNYCLYNNGHCLQCGVDGHVSISELVEPVSGLIV